MNVRDSLCFALTGLQSGGDSPPPGNLPNPGIKPRSPTLQADFLPCEPPGKPKQKIGAIISPGEVVLWKD